MRRQLRPGLIDAEPGERRFGEQQVRPSSLEAVLQQPMRDDDVDASHLAAAADPLPQEATMVGDDLEIQV